MLSNHMKYAALWLRDRGESRGLVAKIHGVPVEYIAELEKHRDEVKNKNRDDLIQHFTRLKT